MRHGGDLAESSLFEGREEEWLDLSTGINPHSWPIPDGLTGFRGWRRLPSRRDLDTLLEAAREAYRAPRHLSMVAAPGTQALIQWLPRLAPPGPVAVVGPTYSEHSAAWRLAGFSCLDIADPADLPAEARHAVIVSPNNPDGRMLPAASLLDLARLCEGRGGWLILDESFADLDPASSLVPLLGDLPIIVLRSFGKFYGLPGLRLGFAIGPPEIVGRIADALGPWAVSAPALAVGAAALADAGWAEEMRVRLASERGCLDVVLTEAGLEIVGGTDLYRLVRHPEAPRVHTRLEEAGIWVRRFDDRQDLLRFGLPPDSAGLDRLRKALQRL